jgi:hypothetical protein
VAIQQISKHTCLKHILATHTHTKEWEKRDREREKQKTMQIRHYLGLSVFQKLELHVEYFSKIKTCDMFSRNPMGSLQNAGLPILKSPPWDLVIYNTYPPHPHLSFPLSHGPSSSTKTVHKNRSTWENATLGRDKSGNPETSQFRSWGCLVWLSHRCHTWGSWGSLPSADFTWDWCCRTHKLDQIRWNSSNFQET